MLVVETIRIQQDDSLIVCPVIVVNSKCVSFPFQKDFDVRELREMNKQASRMMGEVVGQHPDVAPSVHLYFTQVGCQGNTSFLKHPVKSCCINWLCQYHLVSTFRFSCSSKGTVCLVLQPFLILTLCRPTCPHPLPLALCPAAAAATVRCPAVHEAVCLVVAHAPVPVSQRLSTLVVTCWQVGLKHWHMLAGSCFKQYCDGHATLPNDSKWSLLA